MKTILTSKAAPSAAGPYSVAVKTGSLIFLSGQIAPDATGPNPTAAQTYKILENIKEILMSFELSMSNIVKTTIYLTDLSQFATVNEIYGSFFQSDYPARSCVEVSRLPKDAMVEIEAIIDAS